MTTSTHLPVCVYCSTARPADRTGCPTCGRPWIDVRIGSGEPVVAGATVTAAATQPEPAPDPGPAASEEPASPSSNRSKPATVAAVAAAAAAAANEDSAPTEPDQPPFDQDSAGNGVQDPIENDDADAPDPMPPAVPAAAGATGSGDTAVDKPEDDADTTTPENAGDNEPANAQAESDNGDAPEPPPPTENPEPVAAAPPPPPPPPPAPSDGADWKRWLVPAGLAAAAVIVFGAILFIVLDRGGESETALETTAAPTTQAPTTAAAPATTEAPATTAAAPTTTAPTTTSTSAPTTTTTLVPPVEAFEPAGEPIALGDLTLRASAIGPITFGTDASEAVGRLVSSLGTADETGVAGTELGMCAEGDGIFVRFGDLTVIVSGDAETGTLAGFRHESSDGGSAEPALVTPSGLSVGDTLGSLEGIYSGYKIVYQSVDGELMFQLMEGGEVLLWGPITSTETGGVVTGISSALICPDP